MAALSASAFHRDPLCSHPFSRSFCFAIAVIRDDLQAFFNFFQTCHMSPKLIRRPRSARILHRIALGREFKPLSAASRLSIWAHSYVVQSWEVFVSREAKPPKIVGTVEAAINNIAVTWNYNAQATCSTSNMFEFETRRPCLLTVCLTCGPVLPVPIRPRFYRHDVPVQLSGPRCSLPRQDTFELGLRHALTKS